MRDDKLYALTAKLYLYSFFDTFILIFPLYTLLLADHGLTAVQISSLLMVWSISSFILELPSGVLADKFSYKTIILIGMLAKIIGYSFWLFMPTYTGFLIGFALWGVKTAFCIGAQEALVYDELKRLKRQSLYAKVTGRMEALKSLGYVLSGLGAGILASHGYNLLLALSLGAMGIAATSLYLLPSAPKTADAQDSSYLSYLQEGIKLVRKNTKLLYIVLFMSVVFGFGVIDEFFSLFFREKGIANAQVGLWVGFIFLMGGLGNLLAHKLDGKRIPTVLSLVGWAAVFSLASISPAWLAPLFIGLYMFYFSGLVVLMHTYLQRETTSKLRATTVSIAAVGIEAISLAVYALVSFGARLSYSHALRISSLALVGCAVALLAGFRSGRLVSEKPAKATGK